MILFISFIVNSCPASENSGLVRVKIRYLARGFLVKVYPLRSILPYWFRQLAVYAPKLPILLRTPAAYFWCFVRPALYYL
jgi:hypothetical protein